MGGHGDHFCRAFVLFQKERVDLTTGFEKSKGYEDEALDTFGYRFAFCDFYCAKYPGGRGPVFLLEGGGLQDIGAIRDLCRGFRGGLADRVAGEEKGPWLKV